MKEKKPKLQDFNPTKTQLLDLFKISISICQIARHDLNNQAVGMIGYLQLADRIFQDIDKEALSNRSSKDRENLSEKLSSGRELLQAAYTHTSMIAMSLEIFFKPYSNLDFDELFISRPFMIVNVIRRQLNYPEIIIDKKAHRSLEIVFPENILFGILSELINNAGKPKETNRKVFIKWEIQGKTFKCEIHDNGPGINRALGKKFVPLDLLELDVKEEGKGQGLNIINKILTTAQGLLLFSNSKILGGTLVYFEFPVFGYHKEGM
jgi:K+-sensing histidine kinase KdpD